MTPCCVDWRSGLRSRFRYKGASPSIFVLVFYRLLFLLLIAFNIGVAAWLAFGRAPVTPLPPATDPGIPELKLLSERAGAPAPIAAESRAAEASDRCESIGPFPTQADMRAAMQTLTPHVPRIQYREEQTRQSRGFWVYLPALPTRDAALSAARSLSAKGVHDYYVVTAGDQQNTISLGLFHDRGNADNRRAQIAALGFNAQVTERVETLPVYWVDFALPSTPGFAWRTWLPGRSDLQMHTVDCF